MRLLLLLATLGLANAAQAQMPPVPGTKTLAIGTLTVGWTPEKLRPVMPSEVHDTVALYLKGGIDQWYVQKNRPGVVFILTEPDPTKAKAELDALPLVKAGLMRFEVVPLGPLAPLGMLIEQEGE